MEGCVSRGSWGSLARSRSAGKRHEVTIWSRRTPTWYLKILGMDTKQKCCCLCRNENEMCLVENGGHPRHHWLWPGLWAEETSGHSCPSQGAVQQSQAVPTQGSPAALRVAVPIRSKGGGQQGHQQLGGSRVPRGTPGQPQSAATLPGTQHFPSQLGQFLPPAEEQVLSRIVLHHHRPQPRAAPHHSQRHSIPFPSPPYSPTATSLATGVALGRTKDVSTTSGGSLYLRGPSCCSAAQSHSWHPEPWDLAWGHLQCDVKAHVLLLSCTSLHQSQSIPPLRGGRRTRRVS